MRLETGRSEMINLYAHEKIRSLEREITEARSRRISTRDITPAERSRAAERLVRENRRFLPKAFGWTARLIPGPR